MDETVSVGGAQKMGKKAKRVVFDGGNDSDSDSPAFKTTLAKALLIAIIVVLIISVAVFCMRSCGGIRKRLEGAGWVLYSREGCPACVQQLEVLGGDYDMMVKCGAENRQLSSYTDNPPLSCGDVEAFPYWYNENTKEKRVGLQTRKELLAMLSEEESS